MERKWLRYGWSDEGRPIRLGEGGWTWTMPGYLGAEVSLLGLLRLFR